MSIGTWKTTRPKYRLIVDQEKAALNGISEDDVARAMQVASAGYQAGLLHQASEKEDIPLNVRLDRATRSDLDRMQSLQIAGRGGQLVALGELVHVEKVMEDKSIYHKNLMPVTYVTADIAGAMESPVYAILEARTGDRQVQNSRRLSDRAAHGRAAHRSRALFDEVGRRVAHHL